MSFLTILPFGYQMPFPPAQAIFAGVDVLITVRVP